MEPRMKDILVKARELISKEENWTQGEFGRNAQGDSVTKDHLNEATRFCATGALIRAMQLLQGNADAIYRIYEKWGHFSLIHFNDRHTHTEVLALFDKLINEA